MAFSNMASPQQPLDLVGGPFAVIESDPGVFTSLVRKLGVRGIELVEVYGIEPWALDHLNPHGLIFCFLWHKDSHRPADFNDPAAENVWFANQLSDDACATHAVLNVILNCPGIDVGGELDRFRKDTEEMSPMMKGLALTNVQSFRRAHNSLARPTDIRGAVNALATATLDLEKEREKEQRRKKNAAEKPPPPKRRKPDNSSPRKGKAPAKEQPDESEQGYHFIGYVPAHGKVWELDGFKSGPLEVGELPIEPVSPETDASQTKNSWTDVVRPALRMKMDKYGGSGDDGSNIQFSLLAIVDDGYQTAFDNLELLKREKASIEKRLPQGWETQVNMASWETTFTGGDRQSLLATASEPYPYSKTFASRRMERDLEIMKMSQDELIASWNACTDKIRMAVISLEDELSKGTRTNTDHLNRTFDYEPFFKAFITSLHNEGILNGLLDLDENGKRRKATTSAKKPQG